MRTLANSECPDETPHIATFHQGIHYLLRQKRSSEKGIHFLVGNNNLQPLDI